MRYVLFRNGLLFDSSVIFIFRSIPEIIITKIMEILTMSWMFDNRWFWGLNNPFAEFLLLLPVALNIACLIGVPLERFGESV